MKKIAMALALIFAAGNAHAAAPSELLALVIKNANTLKITHSADGRKMSNDSFIELLSGFIAGSESARVKVTSICSADQASKGRIGARVENCSLSVSIKDKKEDYEGMLKIDMQISTAVVPDAKPKLTTQNVSVMLIE